MATGYLSGNRQGRPGYTSAAVGTGYGFLARDQTVREVNDRGWENLPPWGYARNGADPWKGGLAGLAGAGCCASGVGGLAGLGLAGADAVEGTAVIAARAYVTALQNAMANGVVLPDFSSANSLLNEVVDTNTLNAISDAASSARNQIQNLINYGNDEGGEAEYRASIQMSVVQLQTIAAGVAPRQSLGADVSATDAQAAAAKSGAESKTWLQSFAGTDAAKGVIVTGAFTAGATGINKEAIQKEAWRLNNADIDVNKIIKKGEAFASYGKYLGIAAALGVGYIIAKKAGIL